MCVWKGGEKKGGGGKTWTAKAYNNTIIVIFFQPCLVISRCESIRNDKEEKNSSDLLTPKMNGGHLIDTYSKLVVDSSKMEVTA